MMNQIIIIPDDRRVSSRKRSERTKPSSCKLGEEIFCSKATISKYALIFCIYMFKCAVPTSSFTTSPIGITKEYSLQPTISRKSSSYNRNFPYYESVNDSPGRVSKMGSPSMILRSVPGGDNESITSANTVSTTSTAGSTMINGSVNGSGGGLAPPFLVTLDDATAYSYKDAIMRTVAWVSAAFIFGSGLWVVGGPTAGEEFFAGYLVEQSLSIDNLFVFLLLFEYFKVPLQYQDRVLNWGIYGAIVMRAIMIGVGVTALQNFRGILLLFAGILVYGSAKFFINAQDEDSDDEDPSENQIIQFSQKLFQSVDEYDGDRFFTMQDGIRKATPLFVCMVALEISDVVFAIDSIPAVFGVTENPLVIFSSNIFAIMGLRSLYTILSKAAADLKYLEPAVAIVLGFIGSKMIAEYFGYEVPTNIALAVVATLLGGGVGASVLEKRSLNS